MFYGFLRSYRFYIFSRELYRSYACLYSPRRSITCQSGQHIVKTERYICLDKFVVCFDRRDNNLIIQCFSEQINLIVYYGAARIGKNFSCDKLACHRISCFLYLYFVVRKKYSDDVLRLVDEGMTFYKKFQFLFTRFVFTKFYCLIIFLQFIVQDIRPRGKNYSFFHNSA